MIFAIFRHKAVGPPPPPYPFATYCAFYPGTIKGSKNRPVICLLASASSALYVKGDLSTIRLRTKNGLEIITCQIASGYSLIAIQNCTDKPFDSGDAAQTAALDGQEAERDA